MGQIVNTPKPLPFFSTCPQKYILENLFSILHELKILRSIIYFTNILQKFSEVRKSFSILPLFTQSKKYKSAPS